jgi:hypothetical protein
MSARLRHFARLLSYGLPIPLLAAVACSREARAPKEQLLLHATDHAALLAACREVIAKRGSYQVDPGTRGVGEGTPEFQRANPHSQDPRIPEVIRALRPAYITVDADHVRLEFGGGPYHYGVIGWADGVAPAWTSTGAHSRELLHGLWYYADE